MVITHCLAPAVRVSLCYRSTDFANHESPRWSHLLTESFWSTLRTGIQVAAFINKLGCTCQILCFGINISICCDICTYLSIYLRIEMASYFMNTPDLKLSSVAFLLLSALKELKPSGLALDQIFAEGNIVCSAAQATFSVSAVKMSCFLIIHMFIEVVLLISFKSLHSAFTTWLTGTLRGCLLSCGWVGFGQTLHKKAFLAFDLKRGIRLISYFLDAIIGLLI